MLNDIVKRRTILAVLAAALALPAALAAHEGHVHKVFGTVSEVSEAELTVLDREGGTVAMQLTAETRYLQGDDEVTRAALEVGGRVVVSATENGGGLTAREVLIAEKGG